VTDSAATPQQIIADLLHVIADEDDAILPDFDAERIVAALEAAGYQVKRLEQVGWGTRDGVTPGERWYEYLLLSWHEPPHDHGWVPVWVEGSPE
jgi:hypothetical protein